MDLVTDKAHNWCDSWILIRTMTRLYFFIQTKQFESVCALSIFAHSGLTLHSEACMRNYMLCTSIIPKSKLHHLETLTCAEDDSEDAELEMSCFEIHLKIEHMEQLIWLLAVPKSQFIPHSISQRLRQQQKKSFIFCGLRDDILWDKNKFYVCTIDICSCKTVIHYQRRSARNCQNRKKMHEAFSASIAVLFPTNELKKENWNEKSKK